LTELLPGAAQALVFATAVLVLNATPGVDFLRFFWVSCGSPGEREFRVNPI
jgi:hypothetical protein